MANAALSQDVAAHDRSVQLAPASERAVVPYWLLGLLAVLIAQRVVYHLRYVMLDPFALVAYSDGQLYEEAARDLLSHPPLGTQPFFLQGFYAYFLACGLWLRGVLLDALVWQLALSALGAVLFWRALDVSYGRRDAALGMCLWFGYGALAFYENKYLSASLGIVCNVWAIHTFVRFRARPSWGRVVLLGFASGLCVLARPNLLLAWPFTALALWWCCRKLRWRAGRALLVFAVAVSLSLVPMLIRNQVVVGRATVFPSHGGGIPFYIGNHPGSTGLWNNAGGLLSGQVLLERQELQARLHIDPRSAQPDDEIGNALYARVFTFMAERPAAWLRIEAKKLWYLLGNHEFVHDYDWLGERELLGFGLPNYVPFALLLGLGAFGFYCMARSDAALCWLLSGQLFAVLVANLLWFTSAQNRLPLAVPLMFAGVQGLRTGLAACRNVRDARGYAWVLAVSLGLAAQACLPRGAAASPSAAHYYNLANVEETLGRLDAAIAHYARAAQLRPKEPMFWLRLAHAARHGARRDISLRALDRLDRLAQVDERVRRAAARERDQLRE